MMYLESKTGEGFVIRKWTNGERRVFAWQKDGSRIVEAVIVPGQPMLIDTESLRVIKFPEEFYEWLEDKAPPPFFRIGETVIWQSNTRFKTEAVIVAYDTTFNKAVLLHENDYKVVPLSCVSVPPTGIRTTQDLDNHKEQHQLRASTEGYSCTCGYKHNTLSDVVVRPMHERHISDEWRKGCGS